VGRPKREPVKTPKQLQREEADHEQEQEDRRAIKILAV